MWLCCVAYVDYLSQDLIVGSGKWEVGNGKWVLECEGEGLVIVKSGMGGGCR